MPQIDPENVEKPKKSKLSSLFTPVQYNNQGFRLEIPKIQKEKLAVQYAVSKKLLQRFV